MRINKEILRLAIPNILSNISIPLISTVDTVLMGHMSSLHLGAVGVGAMIFNFVYWNFGFLRMGTTGITAQAFGKQSGNEILDTLLRAGMSALILAFLLIIFSYPIYSLSSQAMFISGEQVSLVREYFFIRLVAAPATFLIYALSGWYFGMQDAVRPLIITLAVNVCNIGLSIFLVKYLGWGLSGVAWGTVIAQYFGLAVALFFLKTKYTYIFRNLDWNRVWDKSEFLAFLRINRDIFLRTIFLSTAFFFFHSQVAKEGPTILAINIILIQLLNWMSYGIDGFAFAAESLVGKYKGAQDENNLRKSINYSLWWGLVLAILFSASYALFYDPIIKLFNQEAEIIKASKQFYFYISIMPLLAFACYIWDGIFVGLTASKSMRNSMFVAFIIYISSYYVLFPILNIQAIWIALFLFLASRGVLQAILFKKYQFDLK